MWKEYDKNSARIHGAPLELLLQTTPIAEVSKTQHAISYASKSPFFQKFNVLAANGHFLAVSTGGRILQQICVGYQEIIVMRLQLVGVVRLAVTKLLE